LHKMVDDGDGSHQCSCAVPDCHPISTFLQFPSRVCQVSGTPLQLLDPYHSNVDLVLATPHNLPLLWSSISRSCLPCLLPHPIFAITRRIIWPITGALLLVTTVRNDLPDMSFAISFDAIPRTSAVLNSGIHLVKAQPRYSIEFLGLAGFHSSIFALGVDGIQPSVTWHSSKG
jgi:hypothetical protein